jgi:hypothetical protein
VPRDPGCPVCGDEPSITELIDYEQFCGFPSAAGDNGHRVQEVPLTLEMATD